MDKNRCEEEKVYRKVLVVLGKHQEVFICGEWEDVKHLCQRWVAKPTGDE